MSGLGKDVSGMVRISRNEVGAGTFPERMFPDSVFLYYLIYQVGTIVGKVVPCFVIGVIARGPCEQILILQILKGIYNVLPAAAICSKVCRIKTAGGMSLLGSAVRKGKREGMVGGGMWSYN